MGMHVTNGDFPPLLWEKTGELSDGCLIQALVYALGKSRCSYFADTKLPLASEIIRLHYVTLYQDQHPKSLVRLRHMSNKERKKKKRGKKKKNIERDSNSGRLTHSQ